MRYTIFILALVLACAGPSQKSETSVLVVTGGHSFDTLAFYSIFHGMDGLVVETAMQPAANQLIASESGSGFDVIVFYDMWQNISHEEKEAYNRLLEKGTGMVFLHHSLASYQEWTEFTGIRGGRYVLPGSATDPQEASDYRHDIHFTVSTNPDHPVTAGIEPFEIFDEGYMNLQVLPEVTILLTTSHEHSHDVIGWAHTVKNSRVVYLMPGHGIEGLTHDAYLMIIENAINWVK